MNIHEPSPEFLRSQKLNIGAFPLLCTNVLLLHGEAPTILVELSSDQNIEIWERAIRGCPSIVSGVCLKCPRIILFGWSCSNHVYKCVGIGDQSTKFNRLFKFNHVYKTVCHLHTPHSITCIFCPAGFCCVATLYFTSLQCTSYLQPDVP